MSNKHIDENRLRLPNTLDMTLVGNLVSYAGRFKELENLANEIREFPTTVYDSNRNCVKFISHSGQSTFFLPNDDIGVLGGRSRVEMIFTFILCEISDTLQRRGELTGNKIEFSLHELVGLGMYNDVRSARVGLNETIHYISGIRVSSSRKVTKDFLGTEHTHLIDRASIKNSIATIWLGYGIDWEYACSQYIDMPKQIFSLSPQAFKVVKALYVYIRTKRLSDSFKYPMMLIVLKSGIAVNQNQSGRAINQIQNIITEINETKGLCLSLKPLFASEKNQMRKLEKSSVLVLIRGKVKEEMKSIDKKKNAISDFVETENDKK